MAGKATTIGELEIKLKTNVKALEAGLRTAQERLKELENANKKVVGSNKELDASFIAVAASITGAFIGIKSVISSAVDEYNQYTQAMSGLQDVAAYTGESMDEFGDIMKDFSKYMTKSDIAATIKNFSLMGMSAKQTRQMMEALTNSAIKNRNANYSVSEAVKVASDGYKQGLSTLSDSAGVTENLSVMLDKYAQSIGKTASQLTEAEINQAYLNRTMEASAPFASAMAEYSETLAGKQGDLNNAIKETQVQFATALEPALSAITQAGAGLMSLVGQFISENPTLTAGIATFAVTLTGATIAIIALKKAKDLYTASAFAATVATKGFTAALMANPIILIATGIAAAVAGITMLCSAIKENREEQERLNETTERYKKIKEGTYEYTDENIKSVEDDTAAIKKQIELLEKQIETERQLKELKEEKGNYTGYSTTFTNNDDRVKYNELNKVLKDTKKELKDARKETQNYGNTLEELNSKLQDSEKYLKRADAVQNISKALDIDTIKTKQKEAAQLKINAQEMKKYLDVVKNGDKTTSEYQDAVAKLSKAYPEASTAGGLLTDVLDGLIAAEQLHAEESWNASQTAIQGHIQLLQTALEDETVQRQVAQNMGIAYDENFRPKLEGILQLLQTIAGYAPTDVPNITPVTTPTRTSGGGGSKSYQNKKLDEYKKEIEYKKSLDQISLKEEIQMYQYALDKYAKTTDEKRELRVKLYELNKEMAKKEKDLLEQQTEDMEKAMEDQRNARGAAYDVKEQTRDYDKIIQVHRNYLNQVMKDTRLSYEERKEIYRDELETIREYEQQKRDLMVSSIDSTVSNLTSAIQKQIAEMQKADTDAINENLRKVEEWRNKRIEAINAEYDARLEAIQRELDLLDQSEKEKTREEEDAEYERKKNRLQALIDFEHDAVNRANYQKELDKLVADYQKTLDKRALEDKKQALEQEKELVKTQQDELVKSIEDAATQRTEALNNQLTEVEAYYSERSEQAQEMAEKLLVDAKNNQDTILNLLKNYGDAYEITGQSLGEKLAQGINNGIAQNITNIIQTIQDTIDTGIETKIKQMSASSYNYARDIGEANKSQVINVTQNNTFEQMQEMPSETYRKLNLTSQELAAELAGI